MTLGPEEKRVRRTRRRDPVARFKPDKAAQLDAVAGCPELQVPAGHLCRDVGRWVERLDTSRVEAGYSSLGRHGYHPKRVLAVWVYASLIGLHYATEVARAMRTDAAFRLLSGGHAYSEGVLKRFRQQQEALFQDALEQTVRLAGHAGLLDAQDLAVDSVRLRAHGSTKQVRTLHRSKERLEELARQDVDALEPQARQVHAAKVHKHTEAVRLCQQRGASSVVLTSPAAALMKFPSGAGLPGHRATVAACGQQARLVVGVLLDAAAVDYGHLEDAVREARRVLLKAGMPQQACLQVAADAGYGSKADLVFAQSEASWVDVLVAEPQAAGEPTGAGGLFGRNDFRLDAAERSVLCPAGRKMRGPLYDKAHGYDRFVGVGCDVCPLKPQCTRGRERNVTVDWDFERARASMRQRMAQPGARQRYNRRIATVEPVFSSLEDAMGYRRVSSRLPQTVKAEVLLKLLAHNLSRLITRQRLVLVLFRLS
ncbi:IS1182 family transposase [Corallococcus soli]|uniref:IS1182 family transposase n=1 Tax=Corallococcus soli TaxID=2710757 RepID=UPI001D04B3EE|nr:IS1182 family transposase [Corallococcus soli]